MFWKFFLILMASIVAAEGVFAQSIKGEGGIFFESGHYETCHGRWIFAIPYSEKAAKKVEKIYGPNLPSFNNLGKTPKLKKLERDFAPRKVLSERKASRVLGTKLEGTKVGWCNEEGRFSIENLSIGKWYLIVPVFFKGDNQVTVGRYTGGRDTSRAFIVKTEWMGGSLAKIVEIDSVDPTQVSMVYDRRN